MSAQPVVMHSDADSFALRYAQTRPNKSGAILVATDGSAAGESAFQAASLIATKSGSKVRVLVIVEPLPVLMPDPALISEPLVTPPEMLDAARDKVVGQMRPLAPAELKWTAEVGYGRPSVEIVDRANDEKAPLIVIGLVHHKVIDRLLDGDTALEIVRHAGMPVLLAASKWTELPKSVVVAVDFSARSIEAARAALPLLAPGAKLYLAHVRPMPTPYDGMGMWEEEYDTAANKALDDFAENLNAGPDVKIEKMVIRGNPSAALLELAEKTHADLIVAGTQGAGFVRRILIGSVATRLIRHSTRSLLIVPPGSGG
jgi:nucleotide-binding universal stress UspA family protein